MNTKLSGCQMVLVPIVGMGINKFPLVENIRNRYIKYIDFHPAAYLPDTSATGLATSDDLFVTIYDELGNTQLMRECRVGVGASSLRGRDIVSWGDHGTE